MKSRTLSSEFSLLRKDIFRFAPLWSVYLVGILLVMLSSLDSITGRNAVELARSIQPFAVVNLIYAGLVAAVLFGDLFNTRLCYALHGMPLRRETWFLTHVAAGLLYSLVPHLVAAVLFVSALGEYWFVAWVWLLAVSLQYLFFFGLATLCVFLSGNRLGALAGYGILNFLSLIVLWFVETLYIPLLRGIIVDNRFFERLCPVVQMADNDQYLQIQGYWEEKWYQESEYVVRYEGFGEGWGYLAVCAGAGILLLGIAVLLYRRRQLECAGDFVAVKKLTPVYAVMLALCTGCCFAMFGTLFGVGGSFVSSSLIFLAVGLILGWFGGQMLLQRTVKVFRGKASAQLGILLLAMALSIALTAWDPLGMTTYVPETAQVSRVEVGKGIGSDALQGSGGFSSRQETDIDYVCRLHQQILQDTNQHQGSRSFTLRYTLKNGRQVLRTYTLYRGTEAWECMQRLFSGPEQVLGFADPESWQAAPVKWLINSCSLEDAYAQYQKKLGDDAREFDLEKIAEELKQAVWDDCINGRIVEDYLADGKSDCWIQMECKLPSGATRYSNWQVTQQMTSCYQWYKTYQELLQYAVL